VKHKRREGRLLEPNNQLTNSYNWSVTLLKERKMNCFCFQLEKITPSGNIGDKITVPSNPESKSSWKQRG